MPGPLYRWVSKYFCKIPYTILKRIFANIKLFPKNFIHILNVAVDNSHAILPVYNWFNTIAEKIILKFFTLIKI